MKSDEKDRKPLREKLEGMAVRQKIEYFWDYEKWKVIIPIAVVAAIWYMVSLFIEMSKIYDMYVIVVNTNQPETVENDIYGICEQLGIDDSGVFVDTGMIHPVKVGEFSSTDNQVAGVERYRNMIMNNNVDITIANPWTITNFESADLYADLRDIMTSEELRLLGDKVYKAKDSKGNIIPVGIRLDYSACFVDDVIISVTKGSETDADVISFIKKIAE